MAGERPSVTLATQVALNSRRVLYARLESRRGLQTRECQCVSLAAALSWALSDADGGVMCVRGMLLGKTEPREVSSEWTPPCASSLSETWRGYGDSGRS